jgi:hypothetical protein
MPTEFSTDADITPIPKGWLQILPNGGFPGSGGNSGSGSSRTVSGFCIGLDKSETNYLVTCA